MQTQQPKRQDLAWKKYSECILRDDSDQKQDKVSYYIHLYLYKITSKCEGNTSYLS